MAVRDVRCGKVEFGQYFKQKKFKNLFFFVFLGGGLFLPTGKKSSGGHCKFFLPYIKKNVFAPKISTYPFIFFKGHKGMALPPPKIGRQVFLVHRSGTSIYRKKIDTQKVYRGSQAEGLRVGSGLPKHWGGGRKKFSKFF